LNYKFKNWNLTYNSSDHDTLEEFYKPALDHAVYYKRITGYFTPNFLNNLVNEIRDARNKNNLYIQILCSPVISDQDLSDIRLGYDVRKKIYHSINKTINEISADSDILPIISELIAKNIIDIKFVVTENQIGIFHDKKGIFSDSDKNKIAFIGSNNETNNAIFNNYESFILLKGWEQPAHVNEIEHDFDKIWNNDKRGLSTYSATEKIKTTITEKIGSVHSMIKKDKYPRLDITSKYDLYKYQDDAVKSWKANQYQGLLEMATGTGKTITALACLEELSRTTKKLLTVIVVPQNELLYQWDEDIEASGGSSIKCFSGNSKWERILKSRIRFINRSDSGNFHVLVTRDTFTTNRFINAIKMAEFETLLISDEVHTFGSDTLRKRYEELDILFPYKLGVSATPFRRSDSETGQLVNFFNGVVFSYSLKEAIENDYLNRYEYYPQLLFFDSESLKTYRSIFSKNKQDILNKDLEAIQIIENVTSTIINSSTSKVNLLMDDLTSKGDSFQSIVYCSPGGYNDTLQKYDERHIDYVSSELGKLEGIKLRKVRSQVSPDERQKILRQYKNKDLNVIVAIKCLDQGINLTGVTDAYILSSTDSETEFIQRRGRILRKEDGKPISKIKDYVMLPQDFRRIDVDIDESDVYIIQRELKRMKSYMNGADNEEAVADLVKEIEKVYKDYLEEYEYEFSK